MTSRGPRTLCGGLEELRQWKSESVRNYKLTTNQTYFSIKFLLFFGFFPQQIYITIQSTNLKSQTLYLKQVIWGLIWKHKKEKDVQQKQPTWLFCNCNCCDYATVEKEEEKCN